MPVPLGPHALKTYVRVQEGSEKAMRVQWWAENVWFTFCNLCNHWQLGLLRTARSCMVATAIAMSVRMIRGAAAHTGVDLARTRDLPLREACEGAAVKRVEGCGETVRTR